MTQIEANKIIDRLTCGCNYNRFNEPGVQGEYQRALMRYGYTQMNTAVDSVLEADSKNVPPISALIKACKSNKTDIAFVTNPEHCDICDDKGYVFITQMQKLTETQSIPYQYVLHCICPVGMTQTYNGKECKDVEHRTPYFMPPVTEYLDEYALEQLRITNRQQKHLSATQRQEIKDKLAKFGLKMPTLKPHEIEHGDAWEGDSNGCPF